MTPNRLEKLLAAWLPGQRWFAGTGTAGTVEISSDVQLHDGEPELRHLITDVWRGDEKTSYQVLLGLRTRLPQALAPAAIGTMPDGRIGYDGAADPELTAVLLAGLADQRVSGRLMFHAEPDAVIDTAVPGRTLPPHTSNTSVVFGDSAILKLLRRPFLGHHPDLEVTAALAKAGSKLVAAPLGWIDLQGQEPIVLAVLSEYFPDATDGWTLATANLHEPDPDFSVQARELGQATARLHAELAAAFGTAELTAADRAELAAGMNAELDRALRVVPGLAEHQRAIRARYADLAALPGPVTVQRIHGDLHLAQVLAAGPGWIVLDFEGEPSVPLARRRAFAPALRDVAGMLRSFDYAARHSAAAGGAEWARRCVAEFCAGYGAHPDDVLLQALMLQKAVYESVYEANHRPDWVPIPVAAIAEMSRPGPPPQADQVSHGAIDAILAGEHHDPHGVLGAHRGPDGTTIRALRPLARSVAAVLSDGSRREMRHVHEGVFAVTVPADLATDYRLAVRYSDGGPETVADDPYRHLPSLGEVDLHLIGEGRHEELWRALGARVIPGQGGTSFAVWAPSARGVRVIGDFNHWDGRAHLMRSLGSSGVWELFVPGVGPGARYKYEIRGADGSWHRKADPMAALAECPPATASVVFESGYQWRDADWVAARAGRDPLREPMTIYEIHLGSWRPGHSYAQLADDLVRYVKDRGFTHVEFLPVAEHPYGGSWGYQVTSYYAPSARFGTPDDFRHLIDKLHQAGIGVLVDWVPAHFPRDEWALARFDGTQLYEHSDPHRGEHPDWGTLIFDYGRREVRNFLVANAVYWLEEFHVDGLRVDAVASMLYLDYSRKPGQWTPNVLGGRENLDAISFLQEVNATCYKRNPGIVMIAEESTAWPGVTRPVHLGGLGFGLKWNMGWMHDTLAYLRHDPLFRRYHHNELTFSMMYAYSENFVLPLSHDEVVHGKGSLLGKIPGDDWRKFASLRALLAYMWAHPGKQLLFMGGEFGQRGEWSEQNGLDWAALESTEPRHAGVRRLVDDLNAAYRGLPALWRADFDPAGFSWIDANDAMGNVVSFLRFADQGGGAAAGRGGVAAAGPVLACVASFAGEPHYNYQVGLPWPGEWREVINTDAEVYGGSGAGNYGSVQAEETPWHGRPASAVLTLPPLAVLWLAAGEPELAPGEPELAPGEPSLEWTSGSGIRCRSSTITRLRSRNTPCSHAACRSSRADVGQRRSRRLPRRAAR